MNYSKEVMDHFSNPRNVGVIENADGVGEVGNPVCGDMMTFYIKVEDNKLADVKFQTFGCGAAIAVSSMISEMAKGKTIEEALNVGNKDVAKELGGLPQNKMHCSNLGADALHKAINNYRDNKPVDMKPKETDQVCAEKENRCCPYCGANIEEGKGHAEACNLKK